MESMFGVKLEKEDKIAKKGKMLTLDGHVFDLETDRGDNTVVATSRISRPDLYKAAVNRGERPAYEDYYNHIRKPDDFRSAVWNSMEELLQAIEHGNYTIT